MKRRRVARRTGLRYRRRTRPTYIRGRGKYSVGRAKKAVYKKRRAGDPLFAYAGGLVGGAVGSILAGPGPGTALGTGLGLMGGAALGYITGLGDYRINQNSLMGMDPPQIKNTKGRGFIVRHREYICDVSSATTFTVNEFPLNPGLESTFPWLSTVAQNFEEYVPLGIVFEFKSTSADALNSTNTALGTVIMATNYNSNNGAFRNKNEMENYEFASSTRPSCSALHPIECDPRLNPMGTYYIRTGDPPENCDKKLYDVGLFQFAATGSQAAAVVGELWVTYEFCFRKPRINPALVSAPNMDHFYATTGVSTSAYFGTSATQLNDVDPLECTLGTATITFPPHITQGRFMVSYYLQGSSTASLATPSVAYTNCTNATYYWGSTSAMNNGSGAVTSDRLPFVIVIDISSQGAVLTFSGGTLPTSITKMDLTILPMSANSL